MKRLAKNIAGFLKGYSGCSHCSDSWSWKKWFDIPLSLGRGCFPVCIECAEILSVEEILAYIDEMEWVSKAERDHAEKWLRERKHL